MKKIRAATVTRTNPRGEAKRWPLFRSGMVPVGVVVARVVEGAWEVLVVKAAAGHVSKSRQESRDDNIQEVALLASLEVVLVLSVSLLLLEDALEVEARVLVRLTDAERDEELVMVPVPSYWNCWL